MAKVTSSGLNELVNNLSSFAEDFTEMEDEILTEAGEIFTEEWKDGIKRFGHIDTGDMQDSVKAKRSKKDTSVEIYPQGKDKKGVRNAMKAFILHYGSSTIKGDRFVDDVEEKGEKRAVEAAEVIYQETLEKKGLI